jgi:hypothetical protein
MKPSPDKAEEFLVIALAAGADLLNLGFLLRIISAAAGRGEAWSLFALNIALFGIITAWFIIKSGSRESVLAAAISGLGACAFLPLRVLGVVAAFRLKRSVKSSPLPETSSPAIRKIAAQEIALERKPFKKITLKAAGDQ